MIILAAAIILALNSSNLTSKANWAKISSDRANLQAEYVSVLAKAMSDKVDGKASMVTVIELKETPEYKVWAQKVTDAGFEVEESDDPAAIRVVSKLTEAQLTAYGLEYDKANNEVVGYDWVINKDYKPKVKVDGVIIPEGFVASIYEGEMTTEEGLVIYETDSLAGVDQETAMTSYNQFVWVPVEDFSKFERTTTYDGTITDPGSDYTELAAEVSEFDTTSSSWNVVAILSLTNDLTGEWAEYTAMRESVKINKGFYIGRYEAGTTTARNFSSANGTTDVSIQKGKQVYNHVGWGPSMKTVTGDVICDGKNQGKGAVELARSIYPENANYEVVSTLIYGVQWDAAIQFIYNTDPNSINIGNYSGAIEYAGSRYQCEANNIYELAGNVSEWTMEASLARARTIRGGYYDIFDGKLPASCRRSNSANAAYDSYGFRIALYIK